MPEFSSAHTEKIADDIRNQEIGISHLFDELLDHVCCDVEKLMKEGLSFEDAYRKVKEMIGSRGLQKIQEDTLYAIDFKYRQMKNLMKFSGLAGTVLLGFAAMFKIMHVPLAGILLVLGSIALVFVFLPSTLMVLRKESKSGKNIFLFLSAFLAGSLFILGVLFKIQHWPGTGPLISLGLILGGFVFLPSLLYTKLKTTGAPERKPVYVVGALSGFLYLSGFWFKVMHWPLAAILMLLGLAGIVYVSIPWYTGITWKEEKSVTGKFIFIMLASVLFFVPAALISLNQSRSYEEGFYRELDKQKELENYRTARLAAVVDIYTDSTDKDIGELQARTRKVLAVIESTSIRLTDIAGGAPLLMKGKSYFSRPFETIGSMSLLLPGCEARLRIENAISDYNRYLDSLLTGGGHLPVADPSLLLPGVTPGAGEVALISDLHALLLLRNNLLSVESAALSKLTWK